MSPRLTAASSFLFAAVGLAIMVFPPSYPLGYTLGRESALAMGGKVSAALFGNALVLLFFRERLAYGLGLIAGLAAMAVFVRMEVALAPWNSWIFLNNDWNFRLTLREVAQILAPALVVPGVAISAIRLLPERWAFHEIPLCRRTWPALLAAFLIVGVWFAWSVTPYSIPAYDHGIRPDFRILHLRKRGLHFEETVIYGFRDGRVWFARHDRRWFQYRFDGTMGSIVLGDQARSIHDRARSIVRSPILGSLHTATAKQLWAWDAEGWYLVLKESHLLAFTSEDGVSPPREVAALFEELNSLPTLEKRRFAVRDICFGFCYDPVAALGFPVLLQRMRLKR